MIESHEESYAEYGRTTQTWTRLSRENQKQFASTTPLGNGDIAFIPVGVMERRNQEQIAKQEHLRAKHGWNEHTRTHTCVEQGDRFFCSPRKKREY